METLNGLGFLGRSQVFCSKVTRFISATAFCALLISPLSNEASARIYTYLDFDNSIVKAIDGGFHTSFRLFRISYRNNALQSLIEGPDFIDVSPTDFENLTNRNRQSYSLLARGEGMPGRIGVKFELEDGRIFEPANYMVVAPLTFERFMPNPSKSGDGYVLADLKKAFKNDPSGNSIRGKAYSLMQFVLANPKSAQTFGVVSARGHTKEEWNEAFQFLADQSSEENKILNRPDVRNIHGVSSEDYTTLTTNYGITHRKVAFFKHLVLNLQRRASDEEHTIIFGDDDQKTIEAVVEFFAHEAGRNVMPIKFIVINLGTEDEIKRRPRPEIAVISSGPVRAATIEDLVGPLADLNEAQQKMLPALKQQLKSAFVPKIDCSLILNANSPSLKKGKQ